MSSHGFARFYAAALVVLVPLYIVLPTVGQAITAALGAIPLLHPLLASGLLQRQARAREEGPA